MITPIRYTIYVYSTVAFGNKGNINLSIPYKLSFKTIFLLAFSIKINYFRAFSPKVEKSSLKENLPLIS